MLQIVPVFLGEQAQLLPGLVACLSDTFRTPVEQHLPGFDPETAFDASRGQYNSRIFLGQLLRELRPGCARVLGVTGVDLFIPVLTYVFGEAQLGGRAAVVSLHRLANERYGLPPSPPLLRRRLNKEAVHELGHTYGLVHCHATRCVMGSSTYVEEIDLKSDRFCDRCLTEVRRTPVPSEVMRGG
ncbi:MAG TPA: archaemetzincin family Zn-dependent metalloprotease [Vicinamibacteria bacterium]|nr:archaemetzincin family Zn-dependent metalloprotease [Vicinamibacteria bacterium]